MVVKGRYATIRRALIRLGCIPMTEADFTGKGGAFLEYFHTPDGQVIRIRVSTDGKNASI